MGLRGRGRSHRSPVTNYLMVGLGLEIFLNGDRRTAAIALWIVIPSRNSFSLYFIRARSGCLESLPPCFRLAPVIRRFYADAFVPALIADGAVMIMLPGHGGLLQVLLCGKKRTTREERRIASIAKCTRSRSGRVEVVELVNVILVQIATEQREERQTHESLLL